MIIEFIYDDSDPDQIKFTETLDYPNKMTSYCKCEKKKIKTNVRYNTTIKDWNRNRKIIFECDNPDYQQF